MDDKDTITITGSSGSSDTFIINLNDTLGTTTVYPSDYNITLNDTSYTIASGSSIDLGNISITGSDWWSVDENTHLEIAEIEKMCAEYPALAKVYENFKTVYDLVKQDWKGKKDAENNS